MGESMFLDRRIGWPSAIAAHTQCQLKGDATAPQGALLEVESAAVLAECSARDAERVRKSLLKRLATLMQRKKQSGPKRSESRRLSSDLDFLLDQAEATFGELLLRGGTPFARGSRTSLRSKKNSMSRIWSLRGKVFCGSANTLNDMEFAGQAPLDFQEVDAEGYWQSLADAIIEGKYASATDWVSDEDHTGILREITPTSSDPKSTVQEDVTDPPVTETNSKSELRHSEITLSTEETRNLKPPTTCKAAEVPNPMENLRDQILGGSTRLNTRLEESPMLIHSEGIAAAAAASAARVRSRSSEFGAEAAQPLENFLSLRRTNQSGSGSTAASLATPSRVSLKCLLRESEEGGEGAGAGWCEEEVEAEAEGGWVALEAMCCVCMVGRKGAALVPCGHTFCRNCTKQLWARRGSCPLCNNLITQVLHIF